MADRKTLLPAHMDRLKAYLFAQGIEYRPGRGLYQVLQVKIGNKWSAIYERQEGIHYTIPADLKKVMRGFFDYIKITTPKSLNPSTKKVNDMANRKEITSVDYDNLRTMINATKKAVDNEWSNIHPTISMQTVLNTLQLFHDRRTLAKAQLEAHENEVNHQMEVNKQLAINADNDLAALREKLKLAHENVRLANAELFDAVENNKQQAKTIEEYKSAMNAQVDLTMLRDRQIAVLKSDLEQCKNDYDNQSELMTKTVNDYDSQLLTAGRMLREAQTEISALTNHNLAFDNVSAERLTAINNGLKRIADLESILEQAEQGRSNLAESNASYRAQHDGLIARHEEQLREFGFMRSDRDRLSDQLRQALVENDELRKKVSQVDISSGHEVFALRQRIEDITAQYQAKCAQYNNAQTSLERSQDTVLSLAEIIGGMHGKKD